MRATRGRSALREQPDLLVRQVRRVQPDNRVLRGIQAMQVLQGQPAHRDLRGIQAIQVLPGQLAHRARRAPQEALESSARRETRERSVPKVPQGWRARPAQPGRSDQRVQ